MRRVALVPEENFQLKNTFKEGWYVNQQLHQAFHHYIKVVSTVLDLGGRHTANNSILAYQMVAASQIMSYEEDEVPQARFAYDLSPMSVQIAFQGKRWYEFITSICALIGGTFTVLGLISGFLSVLLKNKKI